MAGFRRRAVISAVVLIVLLIPPALYLATGESRSFEDPAQALDHYVRALYARDLREAYRLLSSQDRGLKKEKSYLREQGAFGGFTLEAAKTLAKFIEMTPMEKSLDGDHARFELGLRLPDANQLSAQLLGWDEERLNALPASEQRAIIERLTRWGREGKLPLVEGKDSFELVKESRGWRLFLNWAAGVRVIFGASVPESLAIEAEPVQRAAIIRPGELFTVAYRVKNHSHEEVTTRILHRVGPQELAQQLDLVECGLLLPVRLSPGEKREYLSTYQVRGELPEGQRRLFVTYEFVVDRK